MVLRIARKELLETLRDGRFRFASLLVMALLGASTLIGVQEFIRGKQQQQALQATERERWLNKGDRNPHSAAHDGLYIPRPLPPLSIADRGINPYTGIGTFLEAHDLNLFGYKPSQDSTSAQRLAEITVAATLQILMPLLIILLLFPSFAGEREQGTLRLLQSLGVQKRQLVLGKLLGAITPLLALLVPAALLGAVALLLLDADARDSNDLPGRIAVMAFCYAIYFSIFAGMTLAVSAWARTKRQALAILLPIWFLNVVIAPPVAMTIAAEREQTPNTFEFSAALAEDKNQPATPEQKQAYLEQVKARLIAKYNVSSADELPKYANDLEGLAGEERDTAIAKKHYNSLYERYRQQITVYERAGAVFPLIAIQSASMGLAGTDVDHFVDFAVRTEQYRDEMMLTLNEDIALNDVEANRKTGKHSKKELEYFGGRELWEKIPAFAYTPPGLGQVLERQRFNLLVLLSWFAGVGLLVAWSTARLRLN